MVSAEVLGKHDLFADLSKEQLGRVVTIAEEKTFTPGTIIFKEGSEARSLYLLLEGKVILEMEIRLSGRQPARLAAIDVVTVGEGFGWSSVIEPHIYTLTATAIDPVKVIAIKGDGLAKLMDADCSMGFKIARKLCGLVGSRLQHTRQTLISERGLALLSQEFSY